jgi:parallel beta-helix repeat protein
VQGNLIGTDVTGTATLGNTHDGIVIRGAANNTIGGTIAGAGNVISGNNTGGGRGGVSIINHPNLHITGASDNLVQGNFIGPDVTGIAALGNGSGGVVIEAAYNNTLTDNTISNNIYGIQLQSSSENQIYNNNFIDNTIQAYVTDSEGNIFNLEKPTGGNYWSDWTSPDIDGDDFVDSPYVFTDGMDNLPWSRQDGWPPPAPLPILPDTTITESNLIGWWRFDEGSGNIAYDSSGHDNDGTFKGNPQWVSGHSGYALEFDGSGDWLDCGQDPSLRITEAVTFAAWIKVRAQSIDHKIGGNQDGVHGGYKMTVYSNNKVEFEIRTSDNHAILNRNVTGGTVLQRNVWYHVTGVYSLENGYIRTYVNGYPDREMSTTNVLGASLGPFRIGCEPFRTGFRHHHFNGVMDDLRIYNRALTEGEVLVVMEGGGQGWSYAFNPDPADGAIYVSENVELSWSSGSGAQLHIVYFGDNFEDVNNDAGGLLLEATTYTPGTLESNKIYYWRVDEYDGVVIHKGDVWSFMVADPLSESLDSSSHTLE